MQDPYCYPNSRTLKNKFGIEDFDELRDAERDLVNLRADELFREPIQGKFDLEHLQRIHRHLFQDLYDWAGEIRTVDIAKNDLFCRYFFIRDEAKRIFSELQAENYLKNLSVGDFSKRLAYYLAEINALHPFREGNGRTQREFVRQLAYENDYFLSFKDITRSQMVAASMASFKRDYSLMEDLTSHCLRPF